MKKFIISEEERSRILGMHHNAVKKEFLFEAGPPMADDTLGITDPTATPAPATPEQGTATSQTQGDKNYVPTQILQAQDKDYYYKKEGDKYYFKLVEEPVSTKAK